MTALHDKATFPGNYSSLVEVAEFVKKSAKAAGFDNSVSYHIELAIDEVVTNVIEHAYGGEGIGNVEIEYSVEADRLTYAIVDHGRPFQPEKVEVPDINAPLQNREGHGLGLYLVNCLMDEVHFAFDLTNGNKLILVKYRE